MMRLSDCAKFVLFAAAASCGAPAKGDAQALKHMGFECHPSILLQGGNGIPLKFGDQYATDVKSADECLALCNKTKDCIAVSMIVYAEAGKPISCQLFSKVINMQRYDVSSYGDWKATATCVKAYPTKTLDGPPQNYAPIPQQPEIYRQDQQRPAPQPGPTPGGRR